MPVLDTDTLTVVQRRTEPDYSRLMKRFTTLPPGTLIATTIVSFEEQLRGWLEFVKRGTPSQLPTRYDKLRELSEDFNRRVVLPFDNDAVVQYEKLLAGRTGVGTMDLRIASIVLARGELLVSRNLKDFRKIPDLRVEDWTRA